MRIVVVYDSLTGNTLGVARSIADEAAFEKASVQFMDANDALAGIPFCDLVFACTWVNRTTWSPNMQKILRGFAEKNVALVATAGWLKGDYPHKIRVKMESELPESARVQGFFVCQGKMRESTRERYLSGKDSHAKTPEEVAIKLANWDEAQHHPNDDDLDSARAFAREMIAKVKEA